MRKIFFGVCLLFMLFLGISPSEAAPQRILIEPSFWGPYECYDLDKQSYRNLIVNKIMGAKKMNVTFVTYDQLESQVSRVTGKKMSELKRSDISSYDQLMNRYMTRYIDGILQVKVVYLPQKELNRLAPGQIPLKEGQKGIGKTIKTYDPETGKNSTLDPNKKEGTLLYRTVVRNEVSYDDLSGLHRVHTVIEEVAVERYQAIYESKELVEGVDVSLHFSYLNSPKTIWSYEENRMIGHLNQTPLIAVGDLLDKGMRKWREQVGGGSWTSKNPGEIFDGNDIAYRGVKKKK